MCQPFPEQRQHFFYGVTMKVNLLAVCEHKFMYMSCFQQTAGCNKTVEVRSHLRRGGGERAGMGVCSLQCLPFCICLVCGQCHNQHTCGYPALIQALTVQRHQTLFCDSCCCFENSALTFTCYVSGCSGQCAILALKY